MIQTNLKEQPRREEVTGKASWRFGGCNQKAGQPTTPLKKSTSLYRHDEMIKTLNKTWIYGQWDGELYNQIKQLKSASFHKFVQEEHVNTALKTARCQLYDKRRVILLLTFVHISLLIINDRRQQRAYLLDISVWQILSPVIRVSLRKEAQQAWSRHFQKWNIFNFGSSLLPRILWTCSLDFSLCNLKPLSLPLVLHSLVLFSGLAFMASFL